MWTTAEINKARVKMDRLMFTSSASASRKSLEGVLESVMADDRRLMIEMA
jgi:hypothetical protein